MRAIGFFTLYCMEINMSKMPELISLLFEARNQAHILHLKTKSYAQHVALGGYYDSLVGFADSLAENYQGRYGIITNYPKVTLKATDPSDLVEQVRSWIDKNRKAVCKESEIQNIIDEVVSLHNTTLYKLKNLF